jgi:hypothetical protein
MERSSRPVVVKRMPERMNLRQARKFQTEVQPFFEFGPAADCIRYVAGEADRRCRRRHSVEAHARRSETRWRSEAGRPFAGSRRGAGTHARRTAVRDLRKFHCGSKSFHSFLPNAMKHFYPHPGPALVPIAAPDLATGSTGQDGTELAA